MRRTGQSWVLSSVILVAVLVGPSFAVEPSMPGPGGMGPGNQQMHEQMRSEMRAMEDKMEQERRAMHDKCKQEMRAMEDRHQAEKEALRQKYMGSRK